MKKSNKMPPIASRKELDAILESITPDVGSAQILDLVELAKLAEMRRRAGREMEFHESLGKQLDAISANLSRIADAVERLVAEGTRD